MANVAAIYDESLHRYYIIDKDTGEILDDAQGYGYRTAQKAYAAWAWKSKSKSKRKSEYKRKTEIKEWLNSHKEIRDAIDIVAFDALKGDYGPEFKMNAKIVSQILKEFEIDCQYKPYEILKVWNEM